MRGDGFGVPGLVEDRCKGLRQSARGTRRHELPALIAQDLRDATYIRGDDWPAAGKRLKHHVGTAFHVTRQGDQIGCRHPDGNIVEGATGQRVDIAGGVVGLNGALNQSSVRPSPIR